MNIKNDGQKNEGQLLDSKAYYSILKTAEHIQQACDINNDKV